jgi:two-component system, OmpR family, sensor histidine kinase KdpD
LNGSNSKHLLVALSAHPNGRYLINWTKKLAEDMGASWTALHVESSGNRLTEDERASLQYNLDCAKKAGAELFSVPAGDVAEAIIHYAKTNKVSHIISGKSKLSSLPKLFRKMSISEKIIEQSGDIDVLFLQEPLRESKGPVFNPTRFHKPSGQERIALHFFLAGVVLAGVTILNLAAYQVIGYEAVSIIYLLTIMALSVTVSRGAIIAATAVTVVLWNFFFIPPRMTFSIHLFRDILMLGMYLITALVIGVLTSRIRANEKILIAREEKMSLLSTFSLSLSEKSTLEGIIEASLDYIRGYFNGEAEIFLTDKMGKLSDSIKLENEKAAVEICLRSRLPAGRFTERAGYAEFYYVPLTTPDSVIGVLGIKPENRDKPWNSEQEELLFTLCRTLSLSLEREMLAQMNRRMEVMAESERLGKILLNSISHELRTPLTTIKGSTSALLDPQTAEDPEVRGELLRETMVASDKLNLLVENLLSISRLESGALKLKKDLVEIGELAAVSLETVREELRDHRVRVELDVPETAAEIDFVMMTQVLSNILSNAGRHTPAGTDIILSLKADSGDLLLRVTDSGPGVDGEELSHLFDKFFRGKRTVATGSGLGLSICKGIVEAHNGIIEASTGIPEGWGLAIGIRIPHCIAEKGFGV